MLNDTLLAVAIAGVLGAFGFFLVRRFRVSAVPFMVVAPALIVVGSLIQLDASPLFVGLNDGQFYREWGYAIADSWRRGEIWGGRRIWPGKGVWPVIIAALSIHVGPLLVALIVLNALVLSLSVIFFQKAAFLIFDRESSAALILLTLSNPAFLLFGPTLLREAIFWLSISVGVTSLAYLHRGKFGVGFALLSAGIAGTLAIRPNYGVIVVYLLLASAVFILSFASARSWRMTGPIAIASLAGLALTFPLAFTFLTNHTPSNVDDRITRIADQISTEPDYTTFSPPKTDELNFCKKIPFGKTVCQAASFLPYAAFGPFWWEFEMRPGLIVSQAASFHYLFILGASGISLARSANRNVPATTLFVASLIVLLSLATVLSSYIILIRFKVVAELFLLPLAANVLRINRRSIEHPPIRPRSSP